MSRSETLLRQEEQQAELLAAAAQIIFIIAVFTLYKLAPKGFKTSTFEPVSWMFGIYFPILCFRFWLALKRRLPDFALYTFLAFDLLVLITLIWSFHIQYHQPATLSLRSPTFLYFFVFLAVRSLSYDFKKVIFVFSVTAILWASLLLYSLQQSDVRITKNFGEYLQANTILIGVEVDKIVALLMCGGFLALAVLRKKKLLQRHGSIVLRESSLEKLVGKNALSSFDLEKSDLVPGSGTRRNAATMMVDLRGFSRLSYEIKPEELLTILSQYQSIVAHEVFSHGGSIDKYMGDGVLAHFGAATTDAQYAKSALTAAESLRKALGNWVNQSHGLTRKLDFGIAVTVGEILFGVLGTKERMEITTIGESVNLSAKLEKHTKECKTKMLTTKKTFECAKDQGFIPGEEYIEIPQSVVMGIPHTIDLFAMK